MSMNQITVNSVYISPAAIYGIVYRRDPDTGLDCSILFFPSLSSSDGKELILWLLVWCAQEEDISGGKTNP